MPEAVSAQFKHKTGRILDPDLTSLNAKDLSNQWIVMKILVEMQFEFFFSFL